MNMELLALFPDSGSRCCPEPIGSAAAAIEFNSKKSALAGVTWGTEEKMSQEFQCSLDCISGSAI